MTDVVATTGDANDRVRAGLPLRSGDAQVLVLGRGGSMAEGPRLPPALSTLCGHQAGKHKRVPTFCAPLDALTNGGLQTGRVVVLGGPPGVTKTGWALAMAYEMARRGVERAFDPQPILVAFAACDEPRDGLLSRLGQMEGVARGSLEDDDLSVSTPAWAYVGEALDGVKNTLMIFDPREEHECTTVDEMVGLVAQVAKAASARLVIVVDSIQTAPFASDAFHEEERPRLKERMRTLRQLSVQHEAVVIAISELNREGYKSGNTADLASFAGTNSIEYGADLALAMRRLKQPDKSFVVEVTPLKNRLGDGIDPFRLRRTNRCVFEPLEHVEDEEAERDEEAVEEAKLHELEERVLRAIVESKATITSRTVLREVVKGRKGDVDKAISRLFASGRITGGGGQGFRIQHPVSEAS